MRKWTLRALLFVAALAIMLAPLVMAPLVMADDGAPPGEVAVAAVDYTAAWSVLTGLFVVLITGLLTRKSLPDWAKVAICSVVAVVLGFLQLLLFGKPVWSWSNWWPIASAVFVFAKVWYEAIAWKLPRLKGWWERHGIKDPLPTQ